MKFKFTSLLIALALIVASPFLSFAQDSDEATQGPALKEDTEYYAVIDTTKGKIVVEFYEDVAPKTVRNFINLAEGTKPYKNPKTKEASKDPYFNGVIFHRVIPGFMIQSGDPTGTGSGGPGFVVGEEIKPTVRFDKEGLLAMANAGPGTSAAQFFITDKNSKPGFLDGKYTIFGQVVEGMDVVNSIANVETKMQPRGGEKSSPVDPPAINKVKILRVKKNSGETWQSKLGEKEVKSGEKAEMKEEKKEEKQAPETQPATKPATAPATKPVE